MKPVTAKEDLKNKRIEELKKEDRQQKLREKDHMIESGFFHPKKLTTEEINQLSPPSPVLERRKIK